MLDISHILKNWEYSSEDITVRLIEGADKRLKVQMRLDLGLLQMEYTGRPDGKQPYGFESLLEYFQHQQEEHARASGKGDFFLDPDDCEALRRESLQYYYRYLSLFHLQEYEAVERDTARNLRLFDFLKKYAERQEDKLSLEQYRPYVHMMNARSAAQRLLELNRCEEAVRRIEDSIEKIREFFRELGRIDLADKCGEVLFLKKFAQDIHANWKSDPVGELRKKMKDAVEREDYETAAIIRDEIKKLLRNHIKT
ncbi:MAG: UvrB/UvrC motif-containing protein [Candidatus Omnitrophota bacterium]